MILAFLFMLFTMFFWMSYKFMGVGVLGAIAICYGVLACTAIITGW